MPDLRTIRNPAVYHGRGRKAPFFEGWYFKLVDSTETHRYAIIPGAFIGDKPDASHAFVQMLDGVTGRTAYHRYPFEAFQAASDTFDIHIGPNHFRTDELLLDIDRPEGQMWGKLRFAGLTPWPVTVSSPGVMGWYTYVPFMECYHGVLSLDHGISGALTVDGNALDFSGGRGYIEKDWGQAFPQGMDLDAEQPLRRRCAGDVADCVGRDHPVAAERISGFIVGLRHLGQLYRFATYTGARIERLELADTHVTWHMTGRTGPERAFHRLEITAWRAEGGLLHSPARVAMLQRVLESLTARLDVRLMVVEDGRERVIFEGAGRHAGLEIVGPINEIQRMARGKGR